jgi:hypothetical protein
LTDNPNKSYYGFIESDNIKAMQQQDDIYNRILSETPNIRESNFRTISGRDIRKIYELYDSIFFENFFADYFKRKKGKETISFRLSNRMTSSGGKTTKKRVNGEIEFEITLSSHILFSVFNKEEEEARVNGLTCRSRLDAALRILEHEFVHLYEMIKYGDSTCSSSRFKNHVSKLFGHTHIKHELLAPRKVHSTSIKPGDKVKFEFNGKHKTGIIYRITKRATVMVKDAKGAFTDSEGQRYAKYYVPLESLTVVSGK